MKFTAAALLALPAMALAKPAHSSSAVPTPSSSAIPSPSATPSSVPDPMTVCKSQASSYERYCAQCLSACSDRTGEAEEQCYYSVFMTVNYYQSQCEAMGGYNCADQAVDKVCGA